MYLLYNVFVCILEPAQYTDDTAMTRSVGESLISNREYFSAKDLARRC